MINVDKYRLVYILKLVFLIPTGLLIPMLALGMKEHKVIPIELYFYLLLFLFEIVMLSLPLFNKIRENKINKYLFIVNVIILVINIGFLFQYIFTSDNDKAKMLIYLYVLFVSLYLIRDNLLLIRGK